MSDETPRDPQPDDSAWQPPPQGTPERPYYPTAPYPAGSYASAWAAQPGPPGPGAPPPHEPPHRPRRWFGLVTALMFVAGVVAGAIGGVLGYSLADGSSEVVTIGGSGSDSEARSTVNVAPGSVAAVAQQVLPSVVQLKVRGSGKAGEGSGIILSEDGYILTNNHVVAFAADGGRITVVLPGGKEVPGRIVGRNPEADIAVVRAQGVSGLNPAELGSSENLVVGQRVLAVGAPLGLSGTVTAGIISALDRPVTTGQPGSGETTTINAIQTDAPINPGNSGGPLVNMNGEVIGINTAIAQLGSGVGGKVGSIGLGFAIPIDTAKRIARSLIENGVSRKAVLGVIVFGGEAQAARAVANLAECRAAAGKVAPGSGGALVCSVMPGSAAARAGLRPGDVVVRVDDRRINAGDGLVAAIHSKRPGERIRITVRHPNGSTETLQVELGSEVVRPGS